MWVGIIAVAVAVRVNVNRSEEIRGRDGDGYNTLWLFRSTMLVVAHCDAFDFDFVSCILYPALVFPIISEGSTIIYNQPHPV